MALIDLKSKLSNYRSDFKTPSVESQAVKNLSSPTAPRTKFKPTDSKHDIDTTPNKFSATGVYTPTKLYPDAIVPATTTRWPGIVPPTVNFFNDSKFGAKGFSTNFTDPAQSKFLGISGNTYTFPNLLSLGRRAMQPAGTTNSSTIAAFPGPQDFFNDVKFGASGFTTNFTDPAKSKFTGIAGSTYTYPNLLSLGTRLMNPNGTPNSGPIRTFPGPQNFFDDNKSGASGFTTNFTNPNQSQFTGVIGSPLQNTYNYPNLLNLGRRLMQPAGTTYSNAITAFPGPQNFFDDNKSGAKGFSLYFYDRNQSQFTGVSGTPLQNTYNYPNLLGLGRRLMQPAGTTHSRSVQHFPGPQDFFDDKTNGATGFTLNMFKGSRKPSQFKGISGLTYLYPNSVLTTEGQRAWSVPKVGGTGTHTLTDQLAGGSTFNYYTLNKPLQPPKFSSTAYNSTTPYSAPGNSRVINFLPELSILYTASTRENSPSAIDEQYKKFNLRTESFNPSYIDQPYILRGIQRKGNEKPENWGFGLNFDDGLVRGGVVTAVDRTISDTIRIAKWIASPKGLLWVGKQILLGLTNPKVEATGGALTRQTRIHTPLGTILSVVGAAAGLHFEKHGIPFISYLSNYEEVIKSKKLLSLKPEGYSRLINLKDELFVNPLTSRIPIGSAITSLSGLGGPDSLYGIGFTTHRRYSNSENGALDRPIIYSDWTGKLGYKSEKGIIYAESVSTSPNRSNTSAIDKNKTSATTVDKRDTNPRNVGREGKLDYLFGLNHTETSLANKINQFGSSALEGPTHTAALQSTPGARISPATNTDISTYAKRDATGYKNISDTSNSPIQNYAVMAYSQIPKDISSFNDFRASISGTNKEVGIIGIPGSKILPNDYYTNYNLETKFGFGELGKVAADRLDRDEFLVAGDKFETDVDFRAEVPAVPAVDAKDAIPPDPTAPIGSPEFTGTPAEDGTAGVKFVPARKANPRTEKERKVARHLLSNNARFRGDRVTAIDIGKQEKIEDIYPEGGKDLINFFFEDGTQGTNVMPFRCTMTGFSDSFSPSWEQITIMGRPDGAYIYKSFDRTISFSFTVAALSRSEMIPMWRKLNYLASYTMPDYGTKGALPGGPYMRITIGDLFHRTPGFITSLTYTVNDDATWDIAEDVGVNAPDAKQLPQSIEVAVGFTIISDYRPQLKGRVYSLSNLGSAKPGEGNWLGDADV